MSRIHLNNANLENADLYAADLQGAYLWNAKLRHAQLDNAKLQHAILYEADLQEAELRGANLYHANLINANLNGAFLEEADLQQTGLANWQLVTVYSLLGATMPDGSRYDGRFHLSGDRGLRSINRKSPQEMADLYFISLEEYERGQEWARDNLERVRRQAVPELELTDAPAQPAPHRNDQRHKPSMVAHRARR